MKLVCASFSWLIITSAFCQADSLVLALQQSKPGTAQVDVLNRLSSHFRDKDNNTAISYSRRALRLADSLQYQSGKALALENTGWILYRMGDYTQSLTLSLDAMKQNELIGDSTAL